jgi:hypothetical protein
VDQRLNTPTSANGHLKESRPTGAKRSVKLLGTPFVLGAMILWPPRSFLANELPLPPDVVFVVDCGRVNKENRKNELNEMP